LGLLPAGADALLQPPRRPRAAGQGQRDLGRHADGDDDPGRCKVVGRTRKGWTLGALEAVTGREHARVSSGGEITEPAVEPLTSYTVLRAQRELGRRAGIGVLGTAVFRDLSDPALAASLTGRAVMIGADGHYFLDRGRQWVVHGGIAGSSVHGSTQAITRLQKPSSATSSAPT